MKAPRKVLALNRANLPVDFKEPQDAFRIACKGNAFFFDTNWMRYTLDEWIYENVYKKNGGLSLDQFEGDVATVKYEIPVPPVMVLQYFDRVHPISVHPTRENIWKRDGGRCGYCLDNLHFKDATVDHIYPQSRGGPNIWTNLVTACQECNVTKDDDLLEDIDMELMLEPVTPSPTSILYRLGPTEIENFPEFWKHFFVEFQ